MRIRTKDIPAWMNGSGRSVSKGGANPAARIALDLLYPRRCPVCDGIVRPFGELICPECEKKVRYIRGAVCLKCGKQLQDRRAEYCYDCSHKKHVYDSGMALYEYHSVAGSIYRFKYAGRREYADYYAERMERVLGTRILALGPGALVPVPIHPAKMRARGYNQAELIAKALGKRLEIPVDTRLIARCVNTAPQKGLDEAERQNNLKRAFKILRNDVKLSTIVIIDDIYTTGSTIDAMARELNKAGAERICFTALAIGKGL